VYVDHHYQQKMIGNSTLALHHDMRYKWVGTPLAVPFECENSDWIEFSWSSVLCVNHPEVYAR
jgi:hypothetical protein